MPDLVISGFRNLHETLQFICFGKVGSRNRFSADRVRRGEQKVPEGNSPEQRFGPCGTGNRKSATGSDPSKTAQNHHVDVCHLLKGVGWHGGTVPRRKTEKPPGHSLLTSASGVRNDSPRAHQEIIKEVMKDIGKMT